MIGRASHLTGIVLLAVLVSSSLQAARLTAQVRSADGSPVASLAVHITNLDTGEKYRRADRRGRRSFKSIFPAETLAWNRKGLPCPRTVRRFTS